MAELAPTPKLRDVTQLCKSSKDVNFLTFFDSNTSNLYITVRHRYNQLIDVTANGVSHLKLFTKFLKNIIDAQKQSAEDTRTMVEQYRQEEPTLTTSGFAKIADETSVALPPHLSDQKSNDVTELHKKTDFDAFTDVFTFERNMAQLLSMYWQKLNSEIYEPLYEYRKCVITKLESIQDHVSIKYDKLIKSSFKLRELKVATLQYWNDLCDARHALRKARAKAPDSNKTKKQASKVKSLENKTMKMFEHVVETVDKFNNVQDEFWSEVVKDACLQLEAMEYSRICFYQEYFDKYHELLKWRRAELENGEKTLGRARKMMMTPFEIAEYGIHPIRVDHGSYQGVPPQQYELPCMPEEVVSLTGKITEQRIDPSILNPVFNPFGDDLKPSTSRHIKTNYSRTNSGLFTGIHDRQISTSSSVSMSGYQVPMYHGNPAALTNAIITQPGPHTFFADNTKSKLFGRTNRAQTHGIGLPRPFNDSDDDEDTVDIASPVSVSRSPPPKSPPKFSASSPSQGNKPPPKVPRKASPRVQLNNNNSTSHSSSGTRYPPIPRRPPRKVSGSGTPRNRVSGAGTPRKKMSGAGPPALPPRRKTAPIKAAHILTDAPKVPRKSPARVAEIVRKNSVMTPVAEDKPKKVVFKTGK